MLYGLVIIKIYFRKYDESTNLLRQVARTEKFRFKPEPGNTCCHTVFLHVTMLILVKFVNTYLLKFFLTNALIFFLTLFQRHD